MAELFEPPRFIAIEGPIRVGKSTLARILAETLHARRIVEPENNPFLDRFYQEMSGMALATQMWFLVERYDQMRQAAKDLAGSEPLADRGRLPLRKRQALCLHQSQPMRSWPFTTATTRISAAKCLRRTW